MATVFLPGSTVRSTSVVKATIGLVHMVPLPRTVVRCVANVAASAVDTGVAILDYGRATRIVKDLVYKVPPTLSAAPFGLVDVTQVDAEVLTYTANLTVRATQIIADAFIKPVPANAFATQIVAEVLITTHPLGPPPPPSGPPAPTVGPYLVYPTLKGLTYDVIKREVQDHGVFRAPSGREIRVKHYDWTVWQWDLIYSYLPDRSLEHVGTTDSDLATLISFFQATQGGLLSFVFYDPDDNSTVGSQIAVADGITNFFVITRDYGASGFVEKEPIGYLYLPDTRLYFPPLPPPSTRYPQVYLDSVWQDPSLYDLIQTELGKQLIRFHTVPEAGKIITMDFDYLFFTRFADQMYEFENFVHQIWDTKKITLESLRSFVK